MNQERFHSPGIGRGPAIFLVTAILTALTWSSVNSLADDSLQTQALVDRDLATSPADVAVLGANAGANLTGSGEPGSFSTLPRAHAIATGDFNKDGFEDVAIGAPEANVIVDSTTRAGAGYVAIIFGRSNFTTTTIDTNPAAIGAGSMTTDILGAAEGDNLGFSVAAGDVNGDGIDDLVIGAPGADVPGIGDQARADTGAAFVIFGSNTFPVGAKLNLATANTANIIIFGERTGDKFGSAVAVNDVNGGGTPDIFIGAPANQGPDPFNLRAEAGAAYLIIGGTALNPSGAATRIIDLTATSFLHVNVYGKTGDALGSSVAVGDVNGGGAGDLIIGAPLADRPALSTTVAAATDTGAVFVVFGGAQNLLPGGTARNFDVNATQQNISVYGGAQGDRFGASVDAGDVSADGTDDLIMGAPDADVTVGSDATRVDAGKAYVIIGGPGLNPPDTNPPVTERRIDIALNSVNLTVLGAQAGDRLGSTVAGKRFNTAGNTDTIPDLLIGAPGVDFAGRINSGSVSILFGGSNLFFLPVRDTATGGDTLRVGGQAAGDELGWAIDTGDLDKNRGGDLILGAPFADVTINSATRTDAGKAYILLAPGSAVPPINDNPSVTVVSPNGGEIVAGGQTFNIVWTASDPQGDNTVQRFEIRLSTDGGNTFNTIIASNLPGTARAFPWNVPPGLNTFQARIRVIAFDNAGGQGQDDSNNNFTIQDVGVFVTVLAPNGGEAIKVGDKFTISWSVPPAQESQVRGFDIFLSTDGGVSFDVPIVFDPRQPALPATARMFEWMVPSLCTTTARVLVRATTLTGAQSFDTSNGNFSITEKGPTLDLNDMDLNGSATKVILKTTSPASGSEIRFNQDVKVEFSVDQAGTAFAEFRKMNVSSSGKKLKLKSSINGQDFGDFFPDGAIRILRITNPPCGITQLNVRRVGGQLVPVVTAAEAASVSQSVWQ